MPCTLAALQPGHRAATLPSRTHRRPETTFYTQRSHATQEPARHAAGNHLNPVRPPSKKKSMRASKTHPRDLQKMGSTPLPWKSQPTSPSESFSSPPLTQQAHGGELDNDLIFHRVQSSSFGSAQSFKHSHRTRKISLPAKMHLGNTDSDHLPTIHLEDSSKDLFHGHKNSFHGDRHNSLSNRDNFFNSSSSKYINYRDGHIHPPLSIRCGVIEAVSELHRAAEIHNIAFTNQTANVVSYKCGSLQFQVQVVEDSSAMVCHLKFQWISGGSHEQFEELRRKMLKEMY